MVKSADSVTIRHAMPVLRWEGRRQGVSVAFGSLIREADSPA